MNKHITKLKVLGTSLLLGSIVLTSCNPDEDCQVILDKTVITYNNDIDGSVSDASSLSINVEGKISYETIDKCLKIVKWKVNDTTNIRLLGINSQRFYEGLHTATSYYDLQTGTKLIEYETTTSNQNTTTICNLGEEIEILSEISLTTYLLEELFIKPEYDINEILQFYKEKVLPQLEEKNKEKVKVHE